MHAARFSGTHRASWTRGRRLPAPLLGAAARAVVRPKLSCARPTDPSPPPPQQPQGRPSVEGRLPRSWATRAARTNSPAAAAAVATPCRNLRSPFSREWTDLLRPNHPRRKGDVRAHSNDISARFEKRNGVALTPHRHPASYCSAFCGAASCFSTVVSLPHLRTVPCGKA